MPVLISNGKRYRVSLLGGVREERATFGARTVSAVRYQRSRLNPHQHALAVIPTTTPDHIPWSTEDDRVLRQLRAAKVSWKRISMVLDDRPVTELKQRWIDIRDGRHRMHEQYDLGVNNDNDWYLEENYEDNYGRKERHVSFNPSLNEDTDDDYYVPSRRAKTKRVYYVDDEFALDEVILLHRIAADWERDRWETICSRFNNETGRNITARQARFVIGE
ncbi:hypothetical protein BDW66DRAFT_159731 [Aspergillus desertorum]